MIVYKVVRGLNGNYKSCVVAQTGLCLRYRIGKTTYPIEGSKLFAFTDREKAVNFCVHYGERVLVGDSSEVEVLNEWFKVCNYDTDLQYILDVWKGLRTGTTTVPPGTVLLPHFTPMAVTY